MLCRAALFAVLSFPFYLVLFYVNATIATTKLRFKISLICCFNGPSELKLDIRCINLTEINPFIEMDRDFFKYLFRITIIKLFCVFTSGSLFYQIFICIFCRIMYLYLYTIIMNLYFDNYVLSFQLNIIFF